MDTIGLRQLDRDIRALRSPSGYMNAGYPRYMGLFGRDSLITSWQLLDYDSEIAKCTLAMLARLQGKKEDKRSGEEPGKIIHEYYDPKTVPREWFDEYKAHVKWLRYGIPAYFSVDSTPLFLILLERYFRKSGDMQFIDEILESAMKAAKWMLDYGIRNGFLRYDKLGKEEGLVSQSWKDGADNVFTAMNGPVAVVEVQGYLYASLNAASYLLQSKGDKDTASRVSATAAEIKTRFNASFWLEDESYYALALDGSDRPVKAITSNPGQLLFTGILDKKRADSVVKRMFQKDMWTDYGIRTHSASDHAFDELSYQAGSVWPHDNWIIAQGLKAMGYDDAYGKVKGALFKAYKELKCSAEYYGVSHDGRLMNMNALRTPPCAPQAWTAGALADMAGE